MHLFILMGIFTGTQYEPKCARCGKLESDCHCPPIPKPPSAQSVQLRVEKRKKGKLVTVIRGLSASDNDLEGLLGRLKSQCGAGGTIQPDHLEIQGDHHQRVSDLLRELGYKVRRAGG